MIDTVKDHSERVGDIWQGIIIGIFLIGLGLWISHLKTGLEGFLILFGVLAL